MRLAAICIALFAMGSQAAKPAPAELKLQPAAAPPAKAEPPAVPKIAFRTNAAGVTMPLGAEAGSLVKLSDDGFTLKVEKQGDDAHFPKRGDSVTVHYVGRLSSNGIIFDSSRERKEPFTFPIGRGKVIRGWDQGIITMSLGERARLHLPSYKAYGSSGAPPAIPPNAELDFDVEVLAINDQTAPGFEFPKPPAKSNSRSLPALVSSALIVLVARMLA